MTEVKEREAVKSKLVFQYIDAKAEIKKHEKITSDLKQKIDLTMTQNNTNIAFFQAFYVEAVPNPQVTEVVRSL